MIKIKEGDFNYWWEDSPQACAAKHYVQVQWDMEISTFFLYSLIENGQIYSLLVEYYKALLTIKKCLAFHPGLETVLYASCSRSKPKGGPQ